MTMAARHAIVGAGVGAAYNTVTGGDVWQGATRGAALGAVGGYAGGIPGLYKGLYKGRSASADLEQLNRLKKLDSIYNFDV
jgi:hypothetical protein